MEKHNRLLGSFSQAQLLILKELRITTVFQLCALAKSSEDAVDLLSGKLQVARDDLERTVSELFESLTQQDRRKLQELRLIRKGMGLRKRREDENE